MNSSPTRELNQIIFQYFFYNLEYELSNLIALAKMMKQKKKLRDFSPQANYTDRATAACRRSLVPTFCG
jgi:5-bromo-4-chloroindolyl phosphate hydrolysis protein